MFQCEKWSFYNDTIVVGGSEHHHLGSGTSEAALGPYRTADKLNL